MPHHYPDLSQPNTRRCIGFKDGRLVSEFFRPDDVNRNDGRRAWLWVDEWIPNNVAILDGAHSPHEYSGYDFQMRKQPLIAKFSDHDHLIIPDLDAETAGDQTVSIIVYTDFIWTRHSEPIAGLDALFASAEFQERASEHNTAVYAFIGILRVMLDSLNRQLQHNERQTYAMEDLFLQRERGNRPDFERESGAPIDDPLAELRHLPESRQLVELRIHIAWLRKQFDAFERVSSGLFDPAQGAFHQTGGIELVTEARPYFQHLHDQIQRALAKIVHLRDLHQSLDQLLAAEQAEKMNQTLLRLSWVSMIFMPVVVIAGIFGMNISLFNDPHHVFGEDSEIAMGLMLLAVGVAWVIYRRENRKI